MAKDKASTRKPRRRNARARDDGGTRRATEATPPVRASKRLSVQVSAAASAFVNFRVRMDAIASIFVNYHEERQEFVAKTEAADLIEQKRRRDDGVVYRGASPPASLKIFRPPRASRGPSRSPRRARPTIASARASEPCHPRRAGMLDSTADVLAAAVLRDRSASRRTSQIADEGGPATHQLVAATVIRTGPRRRGARSPRNRRAPTARFAPRVLIQFVVLPRKMGTGRDSLETDENVVTCFIDGAATLKRARKQGLLRPVAPRPLNSRRADAAASNDRSSPRAGRPVTGRSSFRDPSESIPDDLDPVARRLQFDFVLMLCRRLGVKDVFLFATEAGAPAWLTLGFEHVGSSASLIHLRFDLLFKRDRGVLALRPRSRRRASQLLDGPRSRSSATPRASTPWCVSSRASRSRAPTRVF
ncbi:hypothetical protein JL720_1005 [Aureococcus anophagefferens]|nr:hypothetical protein JL720_1005 [Aureococcus anophagefferens]